MKKFAVLFLLPFLAFGQFVQTGTIQRDMNVGNTTTLIARGATLSKNYTVAKVETSIVYTGLSGFKQKWLNLMSTDSASVVVQVQRGNGTVVGNLSPAVTVDSLSATADAGGSKVIDLSATLGGFDAFRLILKFNSGAVQGSTANRAYEVTYAWLRY